MMPPSPSIGGRTATASARAAPPPCAPNCARRGVDRADVDEALTGLDEETAAWAAVAGKLSRWEALPADEFTQKVTAFLGRRGFSYATIRAVCRRARSEREETGAADDD
jgi:SOS response regulatory protein OraA/RecX